MVKILFELDKSTKNTRRYAEVETDHIGRVYIKKATLDKLGVGRADKLYITINKAEA